MIKNEFFPDGTKINAWFYDTSVPSADALGRRYVITDHGVCDDGKIYTKELQALIDTAADNGGGVIVVPAGTYLTGALFFGQGTHLCVEEGGILKGSDDIMDYPVLDTRIEGESCKYFSALVNADGVDGFTVFGGGTIDGNGEKSWRAFWARRAWNPKCTNKDEQRSRLIYISNSKNVTISGVKLQNSQFWTTHIYKSSHIKILGCTIYSPEAPLRAPSTDAIDLDACTDVLIKNCYIETADDAVALKGGKGPYADTDENNGKNERIIVEDCEYGLCHGALTCGSEAVHCRNIIVRRVKIARVYNLLWLKMRPDTPQRYEHILVEDVDATGVRNFININPWMQFYNLGDRKEIPLSYGENVTVRRVKCDCESYFNVKGDKSQYLLTNFTFEDIDVTAENTEADYGAVENMTLTRVSVNKK